MRFGFVILMTGLLLAGAAPAAEIPQAERRSGYSFMTPDTKAMQDDDTANPGMLWVLDGEALWKRKQGAANKACADCHNDASASMKGVAAHYPAFDKALDRPVDLEQRINLCRISHQQATPLPYESRDLLALTAFVAQQSRGAAIETGSDPQLEPFIAKGRDAVHATAGPTQSRLRQLSRRQLGQAAGGIGDHAGASDGLPALPAGVAIAGIAAAALARLHHRHPGAGLRLRRAGTGRARTLSDVARTRHAGRNAGGAAVAGRTTRRHARYAVLSVPR